ncbi:MAG: hypothetical protein AAFQ82_20100 [Myxococcota bacterium]
MSDMKVSEGNLLWSIDQKGNQDGEVSGDEILNDLDGVGVHSRDGTIDDGERQTLKAAARGVSPEFIDRLADSANGSGETFRVPEGAGAELAAPRDNGVGLRRRPGRS